MNYFKNLTLNEIISAILNGDYKLSEVVRHYPETLDSIIAEFHRLGYYTVKKVVKLNLL